jgi:hypothetical protein
LHCMAATAASPFDFKASGIGAYCSFLIVS